MEFHTAYEFDRVTLPMKLKFWFFQARNNYDSYVSKWKDFKSPLYIISQNPCIKFKTRKKQENLLTDFHSSRKGCEGRDYEQPESDKIAGSLTTCQGLGCFNSECQKNMQRIRPSENNKKCKIHFSVSITKYQVPWCVKGRKERWPWDINMYGRDLTWLSEWAAFIDNRIASILEVVLWCQ